MFGEKKWSFLGCVVGSSDIRPSPLNSFIKISCGVFSISAFSISKLLDL